MDVGSTTTSAELSHLDFLDQNYSVSGSHNLEEPPGCGLCGRTMSLEDEMSGPHHNVSICDDCKFLLLEDSGSPARNSRHRQLSGRPRSRYGSLDSTENLVLEQFSQLINFAQHDEPGHEEMPGDANSNLRFLHAASSHTTPNGSRRLRGIFSDTESDVSNSDSNYGVNESDITFGGYYHGNSDGFSFGTYEGDSDGSADGRTYFNTDIFAQSAEISDLDSDSDIDPMHAGDVQWDFDDHEEVGNGEWEEVDIEGNAIGSLESGPYIDAIRGPLIRRRRADSRESEDIIRWRISDVDLQVPGIRMGMEEQNEIRYVGDPGDYLDSRGLEVFLERLAETDSSRRGAPPASSSFVNNLPLIVISKEHQKPDGLTCAICKELLTIGAEVNQLPCLHLYHPSCILPWLSARNSCPLCRFELPTDDVEYEQGKCNASRRMAITAVHQQQGRDDSSIVSDSSDMDEVQELRGVLEDMGPAAASSSGSGSGRGGWFLLAAAPIVSLMGIVFVLWLGNPLAKVGVQNAQFHLHHQPALNTHAPSSCPSNQRERRWWWF